MKEGIKVNLIYYMKPNAVAYSQYRFVPNKAAGLTKAGLSLISQSVRL